MKLLERAAGLDQAWRIRAGARSLKVRGGRSGGDFLPRCPFLKLCSPSNLTYPSANQEVTKTKGKDQVS